MLKPKFIQQVLKSILKSCVHVILPGTRNISHLINHRESFEILAINLEFVEINPFLDGKDFRGSIK